MGYPVEQQKYQSLANLHLFFENQDEVSAYKRWLDLNTGISGVEYTVDGVTYRREAVASAPGQASSNGTATAWSTVIAWQVTGSKSLFTTSSMMCHDRAW